MKPTPQISSERSTSFPFTDYNYQSTTLDASRAGTKETRGAQRVHGFWKLGTEFHGAEAVYGDATDFLVFTLMGLCCTWPIFSVGMAIIHVFFG
jgi:hypothetical protein